MNDFICDKGKIVLLISTMNYQRPICFDKNNGNMVVINQISNLEHISENIKIESDVIFYHDYFETGLSKSRNRGIEQAKGFEFCCIADNDIYYVENYESIIEKYFKEYPEADVLTFQHYYQGKIKRKTKRVFKHNLFTIMNVSSIEIVFKRSSILDNKIIFDTSFGLGADYVAGEENIFLSDCIKNNLNVYSINEPLSIHPEAGDGGVLNDKYFLTRGAIFYRVYGGFSFFIGFLFAFKKSKKIREKFSSYFNILKGIIDYAKKK